MTWTPDPMSGAAIVKLTDGTRGQFVFGNLTYARLLGRVVSPRSADAVAVHIADHRIGIGKDRALDAGRLPASPSA